MCINAGWGGGPNGGGGGSSWWGGSGRAIPHGKASHGAGCCIMPSLLLHFLSTNKINLDFPL